MTINAPGSEPLLVGCGCGKHLSRLGRPAMDERRWHFLPRRRRCVFPRHLAYSHQWLLEPTLFLASGSEHVARQATSIQRVRSGSYIKFCGLPVRPSVFRLFLINLHSLSAEEP